MKKYLTLGILALVLPSLPVPGWALGPIGGSRFDTRLMPEDQPSDCGRKGLVTRATRTVELETAKGLGAAAIPTIRPGETVRFTFHNESQRNQLVMVGSKTELKEFNIRLNDSSNRRYLAPNFVYIGAGQTGELVWAFADAKECRLEVQTRAPMTPWQSLGGTLIPMQTDKPAATAPDDHSH